MLPVKTRLHVAEVNVMKCKVDAIVNSENATQLGHGGLNERIHSSAGPLLLAHIQSLAGQPTGTLLVTDGYHLPATLVFHIIAPIVRDEPGKEDQLLADCYNTCLQEAAERKLTAIVFPVIGSGKRGFSFERAATIALTTIQQFLQNQAYPQHVTVTVWDDRGYDLSNLSKRLLGYYMDESPYDHYGKPGFPTA